MFRRLFFDHPRSVDESYVEHFLMAARFGAAMIRGGIQVIVHAIVPALCANSGSDTIRRLHDIMVEKRGAKRDDVTQMLTVEWVI